MTVKRVLFVSAGLFGLVLATVWLAGASNLIVRVAPPVPAADDGTASTGELVEQRAVLYPEGQLPKPSLYAKHLLSEQHAGALPEPAFNRANEPPPAAARSGAPAKSQDDSAYAKHEKATRDAASDGEPAKDAPRDQPGPHPTLPAGYHPVVKVVAPGRLDWTYVVSDQSLDPEAIAATAGYVPTRQTYEFYAPPARPAGEAYPLVLAVSTGLWSGMWNYFQETCQRHGVLFAGVHNAGNDVAMPRRARAVLDVLDDVRRRYPVDPDRTYIVGLSGAGHAADSIAHALPELFGGVMAICGAWNLRLEPALRLRVSERLSEAVLTGAIDFNRPELERELFPVLRNEYVRSRLWVYPGMGHGCPEGPQLEEVFQWLEAGLPQRRLAGKVFPASRLWGTPGPAEWSAAVLQEARQRLSMPGGKESGLFLLQGIVDRWPTRAAAETARALLNQFDAGSPIPWKDIYRAERLRFRYVQAKAFDGILNSPPPPGYSVPRANLLNIGVALWQDVQQFSTPNSPVAREAAVRLAALRKDPGN